MNLVIDSSALLQDPSRSRAATKALERLIAHGEVKLFIPAVVKQEVLANLREVPENAVRDLKRAVKSLERNLPAQLQKAQRDAVSKSIANLESQLFANL